MIKAIFYKEWIKTQWYVLFASFLLITIAGYSILNLNRAISLKGIEHIWEVILSRDAIFINIQKFIPLIAGLVLSLFQYIPEMHRKCIKLTLHLPYSQFKMINIMLLYGFTVLIVLFLVIFIGMYMFLHVYMTSEMYMHILLTAIPWYMAGVAAYFLFSWVCLEPTWKRRAIYTVISILILKVYFLNDSPEAYNEFLPTLGIYTLLLSTLPWLSIERFKKGKQD